MVVDIIILDILLLILEITPDFALSSSIDSRLKILFFTLFVALNISCVNFNIFFWKNLRFFTYLFIFLIFELFYFCYYRRLAALFLEMLLLKPLPFFVFDLVQVLTKLANRRLFFIFNLILIKFKIPITCSFELLL